MSAAERHEAARRLQEATVALLNHTSSVDAAHACTSALCAVVDLLNKDAFGADAVARAVLDAAQPPAPELCGCADAERTYEQLLDYTAELGAELDRQRVIVRAAEALVECVNEGHDLDDNSDHPLWNRLDALAAAVRALLEGDGR